MVIEENSKVGQVVAGDYRTASVFNKYNIDFCCNGGISLKQACEKNQLSYESLSQELIRATHDNSVSKIDFDQWGVEELITHILENHHSYIREKSPVIMQFLYKLCKVHGSRHPELFTITNLFEGSVRDLQHHMLKEENILFPEIIRMVKAKQNGDFLLPPSFGSVRNAVTMMEDEHENEGERFREIARLSSQYTTPADGCTTYRVAFEMLSDFEKDLHLHIHLENNILFKKAMGMESEVIRN
jgi:regulator of cell morphogenesis and NO signaling